MVLDVKRAFLHGIATRLIYVELPPEESENGKYVGRLNKTLYGTRDAPVAWLRAVRLDLEAMDSTSVRSLLVSLCTQSVTSGSSPTWTISSLPASMRT